MRYFDTHLHLASPDDAGWQRLQFYLSGEKSLVGGLLILNTDEEIEVACRHRHEMPAWLLPVPYFSMKSDLRVDIGTSGWFKIHPTMQAIEKNDIPKVIERVREQLRRIRGLVVHCYPWGPDLRYDISLPLVIELAREFPSVPILATHGGGYQSWAFRAHTGGLHNVLYDFSVTIAYYRGSDVLLPLRIYLQNKRDRLLFGSDWPSAEATDQIAEYQRQAKSLGIDDIELEDLLLNNSRRLWSEAFR